MEEPCDRARDRRRNPRAIPTDGPLPPRRPQRSFDRKYLWPTPAGIILWVGGIATARIFGQRAFLNVHAFVELGIVVALLTSVVYAVRLGGKGKNLAPRWVFVLNLLFGPLVFAAAILAWVVSCFTDP